MATASVTIRRSSLTRHIALTAIAVCAHLPAFAQDGCPDSGQLRVLSSNGVKAVVEETLSEIEQAIGCGLDLEFSTAASLARRIESGEPFDVAILTPALIAALVMEQAIAPDSVATFARSGVGVGARAGGSADDIGTMEGFRQTLLNAESVAFTAEGQSRRTIDAAFERLGIVETMQPSSVIVGPGEGPPAVAAGEVELVLTLISEIVSVPGLELVGPFPSELQGYVSFAAGISLATPSPQTGRALVRELSGPTVTAALQRHGMEATTP